jgi:outer membrane protein
MIKSDVNNDMIYEKKQPYPWPTLGHRATVFSVASVLVCLGTLRAGESVTLEEAIGTAQKQSEEALLLDEKDTRLTYQKRELWAGGLPNIQGYANAGRGSQPTNLQSFGKIFPPDPSQPVDPLKKANPPAVNIGQDMFSYGLQLTQPIYSFGRLGQAFKVAGLTIDAQKRSKVRSLQQIQMQTLDAWYGVVTTRARLQVLDASLKRQRETVAFMESNFRMGTGLRAQVLLAVASLKALEPERIRAEQTAKSSAMMLNRLMGRQVDAVILPDTASHLESLAKTLIRDDQTVSQSIEVRPDLQALRLQTDALRGTAKAYNMLYRPSLGVQGKLGIMAFHLNQLGEFEQNKDWQIGLGLTWNLFDGLATSSKANEFASDARTLDLTQRQAAKFVRIEIETAFEERDAADSASSAAEQAVAAAREAVELLTQDFRAGKGAVTDLLQAEEGLRNAEFGVLAARYQLARSRAALRVALGMNLMNQEAP